MKTLKVLAIIAITGLLGATAVNADEGNKKNESTLEKPKKCDTHRKGKMNTQKRRSGMKEMFQKLDLTAEQKSAMQADRKSMREARKAKRGKMRGKHGIAAMTPFITADGFDKKAFIAMATEKSNKRIEMRATMFEKKMSILTSKQRVKLKTLLEEKAK